MNKFKFYIMTLLGCLWITLCVVGCNNSANPVKTQESNNPGVPVELLFTDDNGYSVYRFRDRGYTHYYVVPKGEVIQAQPNGKSVSYKSITTGK